MVVKSRTGAPDWLQTRTEVWRAVGWTAPRPARPWQPPTDVYENENGVVVRLEIAGMRAEDFFITLDERRLIIEGVRQDPEPKQTYYQMEIGYGDFHVEVHLPWIVDPDCVEATYENGFLRVFVPRPPACRVRAVIPGSREESG